MPQIKVSKGKIIPEEVRPKLFDLVAIEWDKVSEGLRVISVGFLVEESDNDYVLAPNVCNWSSFGDTYLICEEDIINIKVLNSDYSANRELFN